MSKPKRTELMIAEDRSKVCKLMLMGYKSKTEIAAMINKGRDPEYHITRDTVSYDIEFMKNKLMEQGLEDYKLIRNQALAELDLLKTVYYEAYELSRRNKITLESEAVSVEGEDEYGDLMERGTGLSNPTEYFSRAAKIREEARLEGDPRFLKGVFDCIDKQSKIYGIDAPSKIALTDSTGTKDAFDVLDMMKQKMEQLSERNNPKELVIDVTPKPKLIENE